MSQLFLVYLQNWVYNMVVRHRIQGIAVKHYMKKEAKNEKQ